MTREPDPAVVAAKRAAVDELWRTADPSLVNDLAQAIARGCVAYDHRLPVGCLTAVTKAILLALSTRQDTAALAAMEPPGWQPIATAPMSEPVLVGCYNGWRDWCYQTDQPPPFQNTWRYAGGENKGRQAPWPELWFRPPPLPTPPEPTP